MRRPTLQSPAARALVPVLGGIAALAVIGLALWGAAHVVSTNEGVKTSDLFVDRFFRPEMPVDKMAELIEKDGPLLFPSLVGGAERKPIGIGHVGPDPMKGWRVFSLVPPGGAPGCVLAVDRTTGRLAAPCAPDTYAPDGAGLTLLAVTDVTIDPNRKLVIDLRNLAPAA